MLGDAEAQLCPEILRGGSHRSVETGGFYPFVDVGGIVSGHIVAEGRPALGHFVAVLNGSCKCFVPPFVRLGSVTGQALKDVDYITLLLGLFLLHLGVFLAPFLALGTGAATVFPLLPSGCTVGRRGGVVAR